MGSSSISCLTRAAGSTWPLISEPSPKQRGSSCASCSVPQLLDDVHERLLVAVAVVLVLDPVVAGGLAAQAHDLVHRRHVLGADLDAGEAVGAVVDAVRVLGQVLQALLGAGRRAGRPRTGRPWPARPGRRTRGRPPATGRRRTQTPHWMQAIDWVTSIMASAGTMYSRSGGSPSGSSHGTTRWTFFQCTASMSTIRSLITGMLPIGSTTIGVAVAGLLGGVARCACCRPARSCR